jgi:MYXO-CTERM domain-containing protein
MIGITVYLTCPALLIAGGGDLSVQGRIISSLENASPDSYKPGEVIVKYRSGAVSTEAVNGRIGAMSIRRLSGLQNTELVKLPEGMSVSEAVRMYMSDPDVEYAEPNYIRHIQSTIPDDTYFSQQWALHNMGNTMNSVPDADMDLPEAWDITTGSRDIVVAVVDTGIDYGHPDLGLNVWQNTDEIADNGIDDDLNGYIDDIIGWDFVSDTNDPLDDNLHGTHVSGIIGALGNNGIGVTGVNWYVRIMPLKVCDSGGACYDSDIAEAIDYAANNGADVINASLGGRSFSQTVLDAVWHAANKAVLFVAAAGNDTNDNDNAPFYPSGYDVWNVIAVAASDQDDMMASFSNYGATTVDVFAPGNHTLSTWPTYLFPQGYDTIEGTSMAAPHVSGLAALLMDYYRHFTTYQIEQTILTFVDKLPQFSGYVSTSGRVNAYRSVSSLLTPTGLTAEPSGSITIRWVDNATGEDGYRIERKVSGTASYSEIATVGKDVSEYVDKSVTAGTSYTYRVRAYNTIGNSLYSNEATATAPEPGSTSSGGGGGCSVVDSGKSSGDAGILLAGMLAAIFFLRARRRQG